MKSRTGKMRNEIADRKNANGTKTRKNAQNQTEKKKKKNTCSRSPYVGAATGPFPKRYGVGEFATNFAHYFDYD